MTLHQQQQDVAGCCRLIQLTCSCVTASLKLLLGFYENTCHDVTHEAAALYVASCNFLILLLNHLTSWC